MMARPKNWAKHQHYKGRRPPWIKLHRALLDDPAWGRLQLASKALAPQLWLLASESDTGELDLDADALAWRLRCSAGDVRPALDELIATGWLEITGTCDDVAHDASTMLAPRLQAASDLPPQSQSQSQSQSQRSETDQIRVSDRASHDPHPPCEQAGKASAEMALVLAAADRLAKIRPEAEPPPQTPPKGRASRAGASDAARASYADQAREVWAHYRERWHPRVAPEILPGSHEYRAICDRLREGSTVGDLCDAIDGCHGDPWHQGANDKGAKYLSITLICRSASHVQRYRDLLTRPARVMSQHEAQAMSAAQRFISGGA